jgi:hypothetical protein
MPLQTVMTFELFKASSIEDYFQILVNNFYVEEISNIEYYRYYFTYLVFYVGVGEPVFIPENTRTLRNGKTFLSKPEIATKY